jgi:hypothetical protein
MDKRLEQDRTPTVRITAGNLREIANRAMEKYGDKYPKMGIQQILDENPDWVKELELPIKLPGQVIASEESLRGLEAAAQIHATVEGARRDFMDITSGRRDSVPPMAN